MHAVHSACCVVSQPHIAVLEYFTVMSHHIFYYFVCIRLFRHVKLFYYIPYTVVISTLYIMEVFSSFLFMILVIIAVLISYTRYEFTPEWSESLEVALPCTRTQH